MNDFNFFLGSQKKKRLSYNIPAMYLLVVVVLAICATVSGWLYLDNMLTSQHIDSLKNELVSVMAGDDYTEASDLQDSLDAMDKYDASASQVLTTFNKAQIVDSDLVDKLLKGIPTSVTVVSFGMDSTSFGLTCNAPDRKAASDLLLGLKNTGLCSDITLNSVINKTGGTGVVVSIDGTLKEGLK